MVVAANSFSMSCKRFTLLPSSAAIFLDYCVATDRAWKENKVMQTNNIELDRTHKSDRSVFGIMFVAGRQP